jgi:glycosyltransferase involved in cell wall biosynthesis
MINVNVAVNSLSLGFCGYQITSQLLKQGVPFNFQNLGNEVDTSCYNKRAFNYDSTISSKLQSFRKNYSRRDPVFRLWHLAGSESSIGTGNHLFTFHELDSLTPAEVNIANNQEQIFVSSRESVEVFKEYGVTVPVSYIPLGYDTNHFYPTGRKYLKGATVFGIFGKFEKRKNTAKTIRAWLKKFGNNPAYRLHCFIYNPFFTPEQNKEIALKIVEGKDYNNINFFGYTKTLGELNDAFNCCDVVLDMSGGEGFSLGSFHCVGMDKRAVIHNVTAMKDWVVDSPNIKLVEPCEKNPAADGVFFAKEGEFNIGNVYGWNEDEFLGALDEVVKVESVPVREEFTKKYSWENTVSEILTKMGVK